MKRTIIFDMDGVISDSMPFHARAWREAFASIGVDVDDFEIYIREGMKGRETIEDIIKERNLSISQEEMEQIYKRKSDVFNRIFEVNLMPGICELLTGLRKRGHKLGLVTGSRFEVAKAVLKSLESGVRSQESTPLLSPHCTPSLSPPSQGGDKGGVERGNRGGVEPKTQDSERIFNVVIAGEMVNNGKPDPEPYLKAVSMLGVKKEDCLVIENAPAGITSAKRAGLTCYAVATSLPETYLKEADRVFKNIEEISDCLFSADYVMHCNRERPTGKRN